jgi:hypothetical protein
MLPNQSRKLTLTQLLELLLALEKKLTLMSSRLQPNVKLKSGTHSNTVIPSTEPNLTLLKTEALKITLIWNSLKS